MPELGEIKKGTEIGYMGHGKFIWAACEICKKERWVMLNKGVPIYRFCHSCFNSGKRNYRWAGRKKTRDGYILIYLQPDDPLRSMAYKNGYVREHRLVVAKRLGRPLLKVEHVHHKDGIKDHNEDSNLELISPLNHVIYKYMCADCSLRKEIRIVQLQNKLLLEQIRGLNLRIMECK